MKRLLVILCLFVFALPLYAYESENNSNEKNLQNRLDVFLYYEIYDAFARRHGYKIAEGSYTLTEPARVEITSRNMATDSDYKNFYNKYKDYISGAKSPDSTFIEARKKLEEKNISAEFIPERKTETYYRYVSVNATDKQKINEVDKVWIAKRCKVKPKPYSFEFELNKYKTLTQKDIEFIIDEFKQRFYINVYYDQGRVWNTDMNTDLARKLDSYFNNMYYKCNGNFELFREYAKEIDEKFKNYYPQNLSYDNPQSAKSIPNFDNPFSGSKDFDPDIDIILGAFEGVVTSSEYFIASIDDDKVHNSVNHNWFGFGNKVTSVGKTKVFRDKMGQIIAIGDKNIVRDENGKVIKIGDDIVKWNDNNVIMKVGNKNYFRNSDGSVFYIGNAEYTTNEHGDIVTINGKLLSRKKDYVKYVGQKEARF